MDTRNQKKFVPILLWTLLCAGLFLVAVYQEKTNIQALPFVSVSNAFGWIASLLVLYLILVWPLGLDSMVDRYARQPYSQGLFSLLAFQEPGLLVLYTLPVMILSASFGFKGFTAIAQAILVVAVVGMVTWAHFRLGFFIHGSMSKPYFLIMGFLCFFVPLIDLVYSRFYGKGPSWLTLFNPFHTMLAVTGPGDGIRGPFIVFFLTFTGVTVVLLAVPFALAWPPRLYKDIAG
ncbi:MAG: hypothetical protein ACYS47_08150 [Planctomycetota bacterium]|jgi:hypothetical protein